MSIIESKSAPAVDDDSEDEESAVLQAEEEVDDSPDSNVVVDYSEKEIERSVRLAELKAKWEGSKDQGHSSTRLNYLMAQSEAFCQFLSGDMQSVSTDDKATAKKKGRGRMTEAAEDQEMMKRMQDSTIFTRLSKQPTTIVGGTLRSYQLEGLNWLIRLNENYVNGILADEMGLGTPIVEPTFPHRLCIFNEYLWSTGKTLQTISLLAYICESTGVAGPHIVVVPKTTISNWMREFDRWCGGEKKSPFRVVKLIGDKETRRNLCRNIIAPRKFDVLVTSYEACVRESATIKKIPWHYLIIDEAHRIKNENSLFSKIARMLRSHFRLLITGTPLQNNLHELWALLNFLMPEVFGSAETFDRWFNTEDTVAKDNVIKKLHTVLKPFMIRRVSD